MPDDKEVERLARESYVEIINACRDERMNHPREYLVSALRSAMRIGEKRAYEDAAKTVVESRFVTKARLSNELQAKADSLKGE